MMRNSSEAERGTITLWVLGLSISLMFLGGLSLDLWRAVADRRELSSMADSAATAAANGVDIEALRAGILRLDPVRARVIALASLEQDPHRSALDAVEVEVVGNRVTVSLRDHVGFSLLGIFMGGERFDVRVHASAAPEERP
ncbi:MAG TPA: pilus assembly protein TadG-related protein [Acidimicrobiia bacterium]|nr:pilus assembly protein TadG-related protein [Acidimicrobiia bacterium]